MSKIKEPKNLSPRIKWLRDWYYQGTERKWNNEFRTFTCGTPWDCNYNEVTYYVVPETYSFFSTFTHGFLYGATHVEVPPNFFEWSIVHRHAWFIDEVLTKYVPKEIIPGDLLCGATFNLAASFCLTEEETKIRQKMILGKNGLRKTIIEFHDRGYGNCGATNGHLIPGYEIPVKYGFKYIYEDLNKRFKALSPTDQTGAKGEQLQAMMYAAQMPKRLAQHYASLCEQMANNEKNTERKSELLQMAKNMSRVPWEPASNFWEAVQSLWFSHMLVMADENYPGPGVSFGRFDQYLLPFYQKSIKEGMTPAFAKEILECFWIHCNTAYDAMIRVGMNQGITAGYGQLLMIGGLNEEGQDATNDLSYLLLDVVDDMSPMLEPKPNVRIHKNSPEKFLDRIVEMIADSQGAPFLLNFDERSISGLLYESEFAGLQKLINEKTVRDYASVGCLENTMVGNDRSSTVDVNLNFLKAVELTLGNGKDLVPYKDQLWGKTYKNIQSGPKTGNPITFDTFEKFYDAFLKQVQYIIHRIVNLYDATNDVRAKFLPTPYLSCLVKGCAEKALDITQGGAEIKFVTLEGVTFATTIDSLLAIKYLVYDEKVCTMEQLIKALRNNWGGYEVLQAKAKNKAPKYGRNDFAADELARQFMKFWTDECKQYKTHTGHQFRGGMLSWNYWVSDGYILAASPDGRQRGQFLSNAICPSNGADINGPTSNANSVGHALGGVDKKGNLINYLPNGASHTMTLSPSMMRDQDHKNKVKAFLRGYDANGGTALQLNVLDVQTLKDAQDNPEEYKYLLVRVTGYNAYFTTIGRELQNEIIKRESHGKY